MIVSDIHEPTRRRLIGTLFAGNAIGSTAYIGVATVATLIAADITGTTALAGLPSTTSTLGVAGGAALLSWVSARWGRRPAFSAGYAAAVVGSLLVIASIVTSNFLLLLAGMAGVGLGRSGSELARYAAGDLRTEDRRARAIGLIVWASTIGAVVGPLMIGPTSILAVTAGANELVGPVAMAAGGFALVAVLMIVALRPDPMGLIVADDDERFAPGPSRSIPVLLSSPTVRLSIAAIVMSQVVMVLVMVMTPVHIKANGGSLATVGWVMMAHTLGMFAIAPITGLLVGRLGPRRMIIASVATFIGSCAMAATAVTAATPVLLVSLFLLGVAWNFGYVAGSTLLQAGLPIADRLTLQGFTDSSAWLSSAFAAAISGVIVSQTSFTSLAILGAVLAVVPLLVSIPTYRVRTA
jgi:MFS family permease